MGRIGRRRDPREVIPTEAQKLAIRNNIAAALLERHGMMLDGDLVDGVNVGVRLKDETSGSQWNSYYNGKVRVQIGVNAYNVVDQKGYPQKKDGSHSYDKIADELAYMKGVVESHKKARDEASAKHDQAEKFIKEQAEAYGVNWYSLPLETNHRTGSLNLKLTGLTEEQADAFLQLADELGLIRK